MKMVPVRSSNINAVGYDPASRTMDVQFQSGHTYSHYDVSPEAHEAFVGAGSIGSHYHQHFKGRFGAERAK